MAAKKTPAYEPGKRYTFRLRRTVKIQGCRLARAESHKALGSFINQIVAQEGADIVDSSKLAD